MGAVRRLQILLPLTLTFLACGGGEEDASSGGAGGSGSSGAAGSGPTCEAPAPPAQALVKVGEQPDGSRVLPGGRVLSPVGKRIETGGFPSEIVPHPTAGVAYVNNTGFVTRRIEVLDPATGTIMQKLTRPESFYGMALSPDAKVLYASGGTTGQIDVFDVGADGKLAAKQQHALKGYPAGLVVTDDKLYVAQFLEKTVSELDRATGKVLRTFTLPEDSPFAMALVPQKNELWISCFRRKGIHVVDLGSGNVTSTLNLGKNPETLVASKDGTRVFAALPDVDFVASIDTATKKATVSKRVGEEGLVGADGEPLPASSPAGIYLDEAENRLYVARAGDDAVSVLDATTLASKGSFPVDWYPLWVTRMPGGPLLVANAKGTGTRPYLDEKMDPREMNGTVTVVDPATLDLEQTKKTVEKNLRRPSEVYPFSCEGSFPIPRKSGDKSPIEHVVVVLKENKTYDSVLGDLDKGDRDPSLVLFGEKYTPNLHALARQFAHHDNFYDDSETSVQGHLWMSSSFVNQYIERTWPEDYRGHGNFGNDAGYAEGRPSFGSFFTHLLDHQKSFLNFGEIVGFLDRPEIASHTDVPYGFFDTKKKDVDRVKRFFQYFTEVADKDELPAYTFVLLPRDHTAGTTPGQDTPETMIADNDLALGQLVEGLSKRREWPKTAVFVVEDDPQQGLDHVDYHRSFCLVISPWAKHGGYISSVHTSYPSIFRTIELILDVPPMNRYDAMATPMWDVFTSTQDLAGYTAKEKQIPDMVNPQDAVGADISLQMDFSGPDKNPLLGDLLLWHMKGKKSERLERVTQGKAKVVVEDDDDD